MSALPKPVAMGSPVADRGLVARELEARADGAAGGASAASGTRLATLARIFQLQDWERDVLAVLWVVAFDPSLRAAWLGHADASVAPVTVLAVTRGWGHRWRVRLPSTSALRMWRLVVEAETPDGGCALSLDPQITAWLEGEQEPDRLLVGKMEVVPAAAAALAAWKVDAMVARVLAGVAQGERWRLCVPGEDVELAAQFAAALASRLELPALRLARGSLAGEEAQDMAVRWQRQAYLDGAALIVEGGDAAVSCPPGLEPFPLQFVIGARALAPVPGVRDEPVDLPPLDAESRRRWWLAALPSAAAWPAPQLDLLASCHEVGLSDILRAAAREPVDAPAATQYLYRDAGTQLDGLAHRLQCSFDWDDLVVPEAVREQLAALAFEARERPRFWADAHVRRLFPQGRGLIALLAGPPGTGKTMAAQVLAAELGLPLWRIDLSAVLSKWVGETAKHLQQLLGSREARQAVLLFDEADALYGKRVEDTRDAQDRFANMDVSHLMVAIEAHEGIVLLSTNMKGNIDSAFLRRIRYVIDLPRPDAAARERIWRRVALPLFGAGAAAALEPALPALAQVSATGAQIKNAALSAAFAARRRQTAPDLALLGAALTRELAKEGAFVSPRDFGLTQGEGRG